ncbi:MAG: ApaG domain [Akkermansiaceae bacterium]|nr:ApaG domain [Akkermansiaceae bacterium]
MTRITPHILPEESYVCMRLLTAGCRRKGKHVHLAFRILLNNISQNTVRLKGRKWRIREANGAIFSIEGEDVFNVQPLLRPGEVFFYTGIRRFTSPPVGMELRYFGLNHLSAPFMTPAFVFPKEAISVPEL